MLNNFSNSIRYSKRCVKAFRNSVDIRPTNGRVTPREFLGYFEHILSRRLICGVLPCRHIRRTKRLIVRGFIKLFCIHKRKNYNLTAKQFLWSYYSRNKNSHNGLSVQAFQHTLIASLPSHFRGIRRQLASIRFVFPILKWWQYFVSNFIIWRLVKSKIMHLTTHSPFSKRCVKAFRKSVDRSPRNGQVTVREFQSYFSHILSRKLICGVLPCRNIRRTKQIIITSFIKLFCVYKRKNYDLTAGQFLSRYYAQFRNSHNGLSISAFKRNLIYSLPKNFRGLRVQLRSLRYFSK